MFYIWNKLTAVFSQTDVTSNLKKNLEMKGIITEYIEEKGFGFIKDESENKIFFHISQVKEKEKFLLNISKYYFSNYQNRDCFVVKFKIFNNEKGINATEIELTNQIFNDTSTKNIYEATVTDIKYTKESLTRTVSGIKKGMSEPFGATGGGNGTYRIGYPEELKELNLYYRKSDDIGWGIIEVREKVLKINERTKITDKFIENLKNKIIGKTINIIAHKNEWKLLDDKILEI